MADEYIRKEDAIRLAEQGQAQGFPWQFQMLVRLPPADVVQVVRCKDCKYNATTHKCLNPDSFFLIPKDNDFCSYGEKREGKQNG